MGYIFRSQSCMERAFLVCIFSFVSLSSITFFVLYHHYSDIELYLLRKRLSYMSDEQVHKLWKVNMGQKDRARDLRLPFQQDQVSIPRHKMGVFHHPHPRLQSLRPPEIKTGTAGMKNVSRPKKSAPNEVDDESVYLAPDKAIKAPIKVLDDSSWYKPTPGVIRILSWTWKYSFKQEWFVKRKGAFFSCNLPRNMRCEYTTDRQKYNSSNVIMFRMRLLKGMRNFPKYRSPRQKWLVYESESPSYVWPYTSLPHLETTRLKKVFNITSTYSVDSNVPFRGLLKCSANEEAYHSLRDVNMTQGKTKLVAWFVSNCKTPSRREDYVKELQKYIPVDIYGECGPLKCGSQTNFKNQGNIDCYDTLLNGSYKFYLAFENSICKNYVTEKLWNLFLRKINTIPVVLGYDHYTDMVPKGTFIDVRDFRSPQKLAEYLMMLDRNDELFNQYLRRKAALKCISPKIIPWKCKLCEYLHKYKYKMQVVEDIRRYWSEESKCRSPSLFYKNIANLTFT